jgi:hypothetical protein
MALKLGTLRGPQALTAYLFGLVACFVGERLIGGEDTARWVVSGLGLAAVVVACLLLLLAWLGSDLNARRVERRAFLLGLTGLLALGLYLLSSDLVWGPQAVVAAEQRGPGLRAGLQVLWPILLFCALLPLIFLQWSLASMGRGRGVELGRVRASTLAAGSLAMLLCTLFLVNAVADHEDVHVDLSYFKTTSPSESSLELVAGLDEATRALLFFPQANEVLAEVEPYFRALADASERFSLEVVDRALHPERAREYRVGRAGAVVLERGGSHRKIELGVDLDRAKRKLRKLDEAFQETFLKLAYKREVIYLVSGHGERGRTQRQEEARAGIGVLRRLLEGANFTVKRLDAVGGLSQAVPDDAAMLLWAGPAEPLFPGELEALRPVAAAVGPRGRASARRPARLPGADLRPHPAGPRAGLPAGGPGAFVGRPLQSGDQQVLQSRCHRAGQPICARAAGGSAHHRLAGPGQGRRPAEPHHLPGALVAQHLGRRGQRRPAGRRRAGAGVPAGGSGQPARRAGSASR